jgi:hypothetical protein
MSVSNGQPCDQTTLNNAYVSKTTDSSISANMELADSDVTNGNTITQVQRELNSISSFTGHSINTAKNVKPTWSNNFYGTTTDDLQQRAEAHDAAIDTLQTQVNSIPVFYSEKETFILDAGDIISQLVSLSNTPNPGSVMVLVKDSGVVLEGALYDYTVSTADIVFQNDLATGGGAALVAGDVLQISYTHP